jgi:hypothetical protein
MKARILVFFVCGWFMVKCSSSDEPKPFDCNKSDLEISLNSKENPSTCSANDGSIVVSATGGAEPYTFSKDGTTFQGSATFNNLGAGSYALKVKDKNGCVVGLSPNVLLTTAEGPTAGAPDIVADSECDSDNGSITVNVTDGTEPFQYSKNGGTNYQSQNLFSGLRAGSYNIVVKDANECTTTITNVQVPNATGVDYDNDILPILTAKCQFEGCHPTNGNWFDYNTAKANATKIKTATGSGVMPKAPQPGGSLSSEQIVLIACWVDHGAPKN